jgi:hypothetical protein
VVLLDYLDPGGDLIARERFGEFRMIAPDMALDLSDHLVVSPAPGDETTFAFDLPGHLLVAAIVKAEPFSYLDSNLGKRLESSVAGFRAPARAADGEEDRRRVPRRCGV